MSKVAPPVLEIGWLVLVGQYIDLCDKLHITSQFGDLYINRDIDDRQCFIGVSQ